MSTPPQPQVSWKAIEADAEVFTSDGFAVGKVSKVVGDPNADVFTGLAVSKGLLGKPKFVPSEGVTGIWPRRVEIDLTQDEFDRLDEYEDEPVVRVNPADAPGGFLRRLFGRR
ncbi:MAG TPA: PRC-barrel domain-containing protein [Gaiellaceae bacterium]|nr:PRC-barrel domain-containing protein [Gaiellaceae bacterium]